jgi:hypothetical protein
VVLQWRGEERFVKVGGKVYEEHVVGVGHGFWSWGMVEERLKELGREWTGTREQKTEYRALKERQRELAKEGAGEPLDTAEARKRYFERRRMEDAKGRPDRRLETRKGGAASSRALRGR